MEHLSQTEIEAIVMGAAPVDERTRRHLRECHACASWLAREARLEEVMHESALSGVAAAGSARVSRPAGARVALPAVAALAVVAAGVWFAASRIREAAPTAPPPAVRASAQAESPQNAPGFRDSMALAPGYTVVAPPDYCRWFVAPVE